MADNSDANIDGAASTPESDPSLDLQFEVDEQGSVRLTMTHTLLNTGEDSMVAASRQLWLENPNQEIRLAGFAHPPYECDIHVNHQSDKMVKFVCEFTPEVPPGTPITFGYHADLGHAFVSDHYWNQSVTRPIERFSMSLRYPGTDRKFTANLFVLQRSGKQVERPELTHCTHENGHTVIRVQPFAVNPGEEITLRWAQDSTENVRGGASQAEKEVQQA